MRHLHDLHALSKHIPINPALIDKIEANFNAKDQFRLGASIDFLPLIAETSKKLESEQIYRDSYTKFVHSMSYARDDEYISFDEAYATFLSIAKAIRFAHHATGD